MTALPFRVILVALSCALLHPALGAGGGLPKTKGWTQTQTRNFTIYSNAGERATRKIASDLERFREVLGMMTKGFNFEAQVPTTTYIFKTDHALEPYKLGVGGSPQNISGYFMERPFRNYIALDATAGATPYHEYVHSLLHTTFDSIPLWLDEGLAEYYSSFILRSSNNTAEIGHPLLGHLFYLSRKRMLGLDELFATDHRSPNYNESDRQGVFYAQSWLLVHFLAANEERRVRFGKFLSAVRDGADAEVALRAALGVDIPTLEAQLKKYLGTADLFYRLELDEDVEADSVELAEMPAGDVLYRLGELLAQRGPSQAAAAKRHLEAALEQGGPTPLIQATLGLVADHLDEPVAAETWYRKAIESGEARSEDYVLLANLLINRYIEENPRVEESTSTPAPVDDARGMYIQALGRDPANVEAMAGLGKTYLFRTDRPEEGVRLLRNAATQRPFRTDILYDLICLLAAAGETTEAWGLIETRLREKAEDPNVVRNAQSCVAYEQFQVADELLRGGDLEGALGTLGALLAHIDDPQLKSNVAQALEQLRSAPRAATGRARTQEQPETKTAADVELPDEPFARAVALAEQGELKKALEIAETLVADCSPPACESAQQLADALREATEARAVVDRYNEAVALLSMGQRDTGIRILRKLQQTVTDPDLQQAIRDALRQAGERP